MLVIVALVIGIVVLLIGAGYYAMWLRHSMQHNLAQMQQGFMLQFENMANRIFEEKGYKFLQQNQSGLDYMLRPLGDKLKDFESRVNQAYEVENRERFSLKLHLEELLRLNQVMSVEARNLTKALKGDSKVQGDWGEMILEGLLQKAGLVRDREYKVQLSMEQDGERYRPDVVVNLPENKSLVIDAKVSLTAYARYSAEVDSVLLEQHLKEHITSLRSHIKNLSSKNYHKLYALDSVDFVLLFVPIEAAYLLALGYDHGIIDDALNKNIIIVCPSTLLATLRTVHNVWRNEKALHNANEIARVGGELYDRFVGFLEDLDKIKKSIDTVASSYDAAITGLSGNKGVIKSVMKLGKLGVKSSKILKSKWYEDNISDS